MSIRDGDRLPRRRILTGSDLMIIGDRMPGKRYNGFIKSELNKIAARWPAKAVA